MSFQACFEQKKLERKDGTDSQVNNPCKVKPKFARESNTLVSFSKDMRNHKIHANQKPLTIKPFGS